MRYTFKQVLDKIRDFLSGHDEQDYSENDSLISTIEQAIQKKTAVHVILAETSFTGDIVKYDVSRQQIIVKNFTRNVTSKGYVLSHPLSRELKKIDLRKSEMFMHPTLFLNGFVQNEGELRCGHRTHFSPNHVASDKRYSALQW